MMIVSSLEGRFLAVAGSSPIFHINDLIDNSIALFQLPQHSAIAKKMKFALSHLLCILTDNEAIYVVDLSCNYKVVLVQKLELN